MHVFFKHWYPIILKNLLKKLFYNMICISTHITQHSKILVSVVLKDLSPTLADTIDTVPIAWTVPFRISIAPNQHSTIHQWALFIYARRHYLPHQKPLSEYLAYYISDSLSNTLVASVSATLYRSLYAVFHTWIRSCFKPSNGSHHIQNKM